MPGSRILVVRSDRLGDVILCSGYLESLAESYPDHQIDLWLAPDTAVCSQILDQRITVRKLPFDRHLRSGFDGAIAWLETMQREDYAFTIVPQFTLGFAEIMALGYLDLGTRWGFLNRQLSVRPEWLYPAIGAPRWNQADWMQSGATVDPFLPEVEKYRLLAQAQMFKESNVEPRLWGISPGVGSSGLLIWPGSGDEKRRWPADRFARVAKDLRAEKVVIGTIDGDEVPAGELCRCLEDSGVAAEICCRDAGDLRGTAQWLSGFHRVLTNDTGIAHLAAAAGVDVVSISGSHFQGRFAAFGPKALTIFADVPCRRCDEKCIFDSALYPCVAQIDPGPVATLIEQGLVGNHYLPPSAEFFAPDRMFRGLIEARHKRVHDEETRRLELDETLRATSRHLNDAERQRDEWRELCHQAERQRDEWEALCHAAESGRDEWKARWDTAEIQRRAFRSPTEADRERLRSLSALPAPAPGTVKSVPRISVITPSFQKGQFIEETIKSVLNQGYPNFEHIVVDGGSTDQTLEILKRYPHLRWVSERDRGQAHAINKGLLLSTGDIVAYLNADDIYRPEAFSRVARFFEETPAAWIVVGDCDYIDGQSQTIGHLSAKYEKHQDLIAYWGWDKWYCIPQQSVFWRRDLLADAGLFDVSLHMVMDYDMWLRISGLTRLYVLSETLAAFRLVPHTKTVDSTHLMYYEEFCTSRKYWSELPITQRVRTSLGAHRHLSAKLLDVAEHLSLGDLKKGTAPSLLRDSVRYWPWAVFNPRTLCTAAELAVGPSAPQRIIKSAHRKYLGLQWRLKNRGRGES